MRLGIGTRWAMADTAMGSVGERIAASAKATAYGIAGISQWMNRPMPSTVKITSPSASSSTVPLSRNSSSLGMRQPSRNSSGGRNRRKNTCGSSVTLCPVNCTMPNPSAICTSGSGRRVTRARMPLAVTARRNMRMVMMVFTVRRFLWQSRQDTRHNGEVTRKRRGDASVSLPMIEKNGLPLPLENHPTRHAAGTKAPENPPPSACLRSCQPVPHQGQCTACRASGGMSASMASTSWQRPCNAKAPASPTCHETGIASGTALRKTSTISSR